MQIAKWKRKRRGLNRRLIVARSCSCIAALFKGVVMNGSWKPDELEDRLLDFAVRTCHAVEALPDTKVGRHVAGQLVRCCTSPAPNYAEACGAESRNDFIHNMRIALKELRESRSWIKFIIKYELLTESRLAGLLDEAEQLCNIFGKSVHTAHLKRKRKTPDPDETQPLSPPPATSANSPSPSAD